MPDTASTDKTMTAGATAPDENLRHPELPPDPVPGEEHDRIVNESGRYTQDHWRDEQTSACVRAARLRDCAQYEVDSLRVQIDTLHSSLRRWSGQVRAHQATLEALQSVGEALERSEVKEEMAKVESEKRAPTEDDDGADQLARRLRTAERRLERR